MALSADQHLIANAVGYSPLANDEGDAPFPVESVVHKSRIRYATENDDAPRVGWPMYYWRGGWWPVPSMEEVEEMTFDSVCPSIDWESEVEPDAPNSWLRALGLI